MRKGAHVTQTLESPIFQPESDDTGLFLAQNPVENVKNFPRERGDHGVVYKHELTFHDGTRQIVNMSMPNKPVTDINTAMPLPWFMRFEGVGKDKADFFNEAGFPTQTTGVELYPAIPNIFRRARNELEVADFASDMYGLDPDVLDIDADSNGAMDGIVINHIAGSYDRRINDNELWSPCFPTYLGVYGVAKVLAASPIVFMKMAASKKPSKWSKSGDIKGVQVLQQVKALPTLLGGGVGKAARLIPPSARGRVVTFEGDEWARAEEWAEILQPHTNLTHDRREGGNHSSSFSPKTITERKARLNEKANEIRNRALGDVAVQTA